MACGRPEAESSCFRMLLMLLIAAPAAVRNGSDNGLIVARLIDWYLATQQSAKLVA